MNTQNIAEMELAELNIGQACLGEKPIGFISYIFEEIKVNSATLKALEHKYEKSWWN